MALFISGNLSATVAAQKEGHVSLGKPGSLPVGTEVVVEPVSAHLPVSGRRPPHCTPGKRRFYKGKPALIPTNRRNCSIARRDKI